MKDRWINFGLLMVSVAAVIALGVYLAYFLLLFVQGAPKPPLSAAVSEQPVQQPWLEAGNVAKIKQLDLFGRFQSKSQASGPVLVVAPKTNLKLELLGVFLGKDGGISSAIIGEIGKNPNSFKEGEAIDRGVVLKEVFADRVILDRNGVLETLPFPESQDSGISSVASPASTSLPGASESFDVNRRNFLNRSSAQGRSESVVRPNVVARSQLARMVQSGNRFDSNQILDAIREDLNQNPQETFQEMGLVAANGGYTIGTNAPQDLLRTVGLRVGDRVLSVNGQRVSGGLNDAALIQSALEGSNARVAIQRGTRTFTVNVPIPQ